MALRADRPCRYPCTHGQHACVDGRRQQVVDGSHEDPVGDGRDEQLPSPRIAILRHADSEQGGGLVAAVTQVLGERDKPPLDLLPKEIDGDAVDPWRSAGRRDVPERGQQAGVVEQVGFEIVQTHRRRPGDRRCWERHRRRSLRGSGRIVRPFTRRLIAQPPRTTIATAGRWWCLTIQLPGASGSPR